MVKLLEEAFEAKEREREQEREEAEHAELERLRAIEEEKRRKEKEKIAQWDAWMAAWRRCREVRVFAMAIRKARSPIEPGSNIAAWLDWADNDARSIDPLGGVRDDGGSND